MAKMDYNDKLLKLTNETTTKQIHMQNRDAMLSRLKKPAVESIFSEEGVKMHRNWKKNFVSAAVVSNREKKYDWVNQ